ncbi:glycosyltransferase involved in cell wall biosynthesis [Peribacillus deserti]|uniref:Glycosyltransferase involved in cell wall biosynthesis n=1 Tax=Peribacillus deserti TaxID=673318 RepID=A0ABS2QCM3_9BACI|nr:glycosyltransferase [Peribacillus deserti]MBM7690780.1 glycosyltransferase involved in cell wall biosynthesis [Peribacillus deserti]
MKKVGLYIPHLSNGGAERVVSRLSYILQDYYEVYIILNEDSIKYDVFCEVINLKMPAQPSVIKKVFLPICRARKLKNIKQKYQLECMISFLTSANIVNALSDTRNTSTILSVRNFSELEKNKSKISKMKNFLMKFLYKKADYVVPVSLALENSLIENYNIPPNKIKTIYNPYDIEEISKLAKADIENVEHANFLKSGKVFVTVGRLTYQKGYWHLIKAFSMLPTDCDAKLLIIGIGEDHPKIEQLIKKLNIEEKVLFTGYQKNPFSYVSRCYAYVLASLFEGFPNAMVEAMACKCPVVAADCKSGPREILFRDVDLKRKISDKECADFGIIVPALSLKESWDAKLLNNTNEEYLAGAMIMLLENENLRNELSEKAYKRVKLFNYEVCRNNYIKVIEK